MRPRRVAALLPTGGTTGEPKAVELTHLNLETMAANFLVAMPTRPAEAVHLLAAPFTHGAGLWALALTAVAATHLVRPGIDPDGALADIEAHGVTHVFMPPTAVYMTLDSRKLAGSDCSSLQYFLYAAAPMSVDRLEQAITAFGPVMAQVFGQIEAPMTCTFLSPADHEPWGDRRRRLASCGRATLLTRVAVLDERGEELPPGRRGEIAVAGPLVSPGYFRDPEATALATSGPWHLTGDIGHVDAEGWVSIVDRKRDVIITGGFNVFPSEVEQVLWSHEAVRECAVIGTPDPKWGEAVTGVVELKAGAEAGEAALIAYCRRALDGVRTPKRIDIVDELPRSSVGKVLKRELRDRYWAATGRAV